VSLGVIPLDDFGHTVLSPDGKYMAFSGIDTWAVDISCRPPKVVLRMPWVGRGWVAFAPKEPVLAIVAGLKHVLLWDLQAEKERWRIAASEPLDQVYFSPDGRWLAARASTKGQIFLWDASTYLPAGVIVRSPGDGPMALAPDGKTIVYGDWGDRKLRVWDIATRRILHEVPFNAATLTYSPDGDYLLAVGAGGNPGTWFLNPKTGAVLRELQGAGMPSPVVFSPDSKRLFTGGEGHCVRAWEIATGKELSAAEAHRGVIYTVAYSPNGKTIGTYSADQDVRLWDATTGKPVRRFCVGDSQSCLSYQLDWETVWQTAMAFTPDGKQVLALAGWPRYRRDPRILLCALEGKELASFREEKYPPACLAVAPDSDTLAAATSSGVRLWSLRSQKELRFLPIAPDLRGGPGWVDQVAFAPNGRVLAARIRSTGEVRLWDWPSGSFQSTLSPDRSLYKDQWVRPDSYRFNNMQFTPDSKVLVASESHRYTTEKDAGLNTDLYFYDMTTGSLIRTQKMKNAARAMALSPSQPLLATADPACNDIHLWNAVTGESLGQLSGHQGGVWSLAFSPDGKQLASGSADTTALVWDMTRFTAKVPATNPTAKELEELWSELDAFDGGRAHKALWALAGAGDKAVHFLAGRVKAARPANTERVPKLLAALDSDKFTVREQASEELAAMGKVIVPLLEKHLATNPSEEVRRSVEKLLARGHSAPIRQGLRAVQVLEAVGTLDAAEVLRKLAAGAELADITMDAKAALSRLQRRTKSP
jgi:WD40 repeat protein